MVVWKYIFGRVCLWDLDGARCTSGQQGVVELRADPNENPTCLQHPATAITYFLMRLILKISQFLFECSSKAARPY